MANGAFPVPHFVSPVGTTSDWRLVIATDAACGSGLGDALPGTVDDVASQAGTDAHATRVVLDLLLAGGLVTLDETGKFSKTDLWPDEGLEAQLHQHARTIRAWSSGIAGRLRGDKNPMPGGHQRLDLWLGSMAVGAEQMAPRHAALLLSEFPSARRVLELGGGHGCYGREFARRGLDVTMVDRPDVVEIAREKWLRGERVRTVAGDFFREIPEGPFDLILCFGICHTFDGAHNRQLFSTIKPLLTDSGGLAIHTFLRNSHPSTATFAMQMLAVGRGGDTHAEADFDAWLSGAGFTSISVIRDDGPNAMLIARP